jgi:hypothetical protein
MMVSIAFPKLVDSTKIVCHFHMTPRFWFMDFWKERTKMNDNNIVNQPQYNALKIQSFIYLNLIKLVRKIRLSLSIWHKTLNILFHARVNINVRWPDSEILAVDSLADFLGDSDSS